MNDLRAAVDKYFADPTSRIEADELYARLTVEAPVLHAGPIWLISGYEEIQQLCRAPEATADPAVTGAPIALSEAPTLASAMSLMLPMRDGEDHRRLKRLATAAFNARRVADQAGLVDQTVSELLGPKLAEGALDIVADLAVPLPVALSCAILDIPAADRQQVLQWGLMFRDQLCKFGQSREAVLELEHKATVLMGYIRDLCEERRAHPGSDLVSRLSAATEDGRLDDDELAAFVLMLFVNGLETLTSGLTIATFELLQRGGWWDRIDADDSIAPGVFDECLRLASPVRATSRALRDEVVVGEHRLPKGSVVVLFFAAANRDPRHFDAPEVLDPFRDQGRHLAFGYGPHFCLGSALSLSAGGSVLTHLARRCRGIATELERQTAPWGDSVVFNTLKSLPVTFTSTDGAIDGAGAGRREAVLAGGH